MSNKKSLIDETIEILRNIREVMVHDDVDDSVIQQLDEAILRLEGFSQERQSWKVNKEALKVLGEAIRYLPDIAELIIEIMNH